MNKNDRARYRSAGITAFCVLSAVLLVLFALLRFDALSAFFARLALILRPFFIGIVLAFLLHPIERWITRLLTLPLKGKQPGRRLNGLICVLSALLSVLVGLLLVYLLLSMVLPQLYLSIVGLVQSLPDFIADIQRRLQQFLREHPDIAAAVLPAYESVTDELQSWMQSSLIPNLGSVSSTLAYLEQTFLPSLSSVATNVTAAVYNAVIFLKDFFIALIVCLYLLMRRSVFLAQMKKLSYSILKKENAEVLTGECRNAYRILSGFFFGKVVDSLIIGVLCLIGCTLLRFPYPALLAAVVGVFNIIPFFGPVIGAIPCFLLILLVDPLKSLYFLVFIIVLQQFDGNILGPKILGDTTGLDAFWVLFSIILFGGLFGFSGMVMGVPVFAMVYSIVSRSTAARLKKRGLPADTQSYAGKPPVPPEGVTPAAE